MEAGRLCCCATVDSAWGLAVGEASQVPLVLEVVQLDHKVLLGELVLLVALDPLVLLG